MLLKHTSFSKKYKLCASLATIFCFVTYLVISYSQETSRLVRHLQSSNSETRIKAAFEIGQMGFAGKSAINDLAYATKDPNVQVRKTAINSIIKLSKSEAIKIFKDSLTSRQPDVRMDAIEALERIGTKKALSIVNNAQIHSKRNYNRAKMRSVVDEIRSEYVKEKETRYKNHKKAYGYL